MTKKLVRFGVVVMVVVMAFSVIGSAAAQGPDGDTQADGPGTRDRNDRIGRALIAAVADATGLTLEDVLPELRDGKTPAEVLADNGIDPQTVIDAVKAEITVEIEQAVADGKIDEERAANVLATLDEALDRLMNNSLPQRPTPIRDRAQDHVDDSLLGVLAEMAGVEPGELVREAVTPPTLAEIAESYGLDADAIISTAEGRITDEVNQMVADGKIDEARAAELLDGLHDRLVNRFNAPLRLPRSPRQGPVVGVDAPAS